MNQVLSIIELIEEIIFYNEKDIGVNTVNQLRLKYNDCGYDLDYSSIYRRIVNYRIAKYGTSRLAENYIIESKIKLKSIKDDLDGNKESKEIYRR